MEATKFLNLGLSDKLSIQLWVQLQNHLDGYHRYQLRDQLENPLWDSLSGELRIPLWFQLNEEKRKALGGES